MDIFRGGYFSFVFPDYIIIPFRFLWAASVFLFCVVNRIFLVYIWWNFLENIGWPLWWLNCLLHPPTIFYLFIFSKKENRDNQYRIGFYSNHNFFILLLFLNFFFFVFGGFKHSGYFFNFLFGKFRIFQIFWIFPILKILRIAMLFLWFLPRFFAWFP